MSQDLISSVPGVFTALFGLVKAAAEAQTPTVLALPFELGQWQPGRYITVHEIVGPRFEWESIGTFSQREKYAIKGMATVYVGDSVENNPEVGIQVLAETFALFQACVMTPVMSNRNMPLLGTAGPSPSIMLPLEVDYKGGPGNTGGDQSGWCGTLEWGFKFEAVLTPR